jgi:hypothetical protein
MKKPINFLANSIEKLQIPSLNFNQFMSAAQHQPLLNTLCEQLLGFEVDLLGVSLNQTGNKLIISTNSITAASRIYAQEKLVISTINNQQVLPKCQKLYVHCAPLSWQSRFNHQPQVAQIKSSVPVEVTQSMHRVADNQASTRLKSAMHELAKTLNSKSDS